MRVHFSVEGWREFLSWTSLEPRSSDVGIEEAVLSLIEEIRRHPFTGRGKPEPLRMTMRGWWSRRIDREHRLVYRVQGLQGGDQHIEIARCRGHY